MKRYLVALMGAFAIVLGLSLPAIAHHPKISADCVTGASASATDYQGGGSVTAQVDSDVDHKTFSSGGASAHVAFPQDGKPHSYVVDVSSDGDEAEAHDQGTLTCGTPPEEECTPPQVPNEAGQCETPPEECVPPQTENNAGECVTPPKPPVTKPKPKPTPPVVVKTPAPPVHKKHSAAPAPICSDFSTQGEAQQAFNNGAESLDANNNGVACDSKVGPPVTQLPNTGGPNLPVLFGGGLLLLFGAYAAWKFKPVKAKIKR